MNTNKHWHVTSKTITTGSTKRRVPDSPHGTKSDDVSMWEKVPLTEEVWLAETRLDNGTRYEIGHCTSEAALRAQMADCERRWDTPTNPNPMGTVRGRASA